MSLETAHWVPDTKPQPVLRSTRSRLCGVGSARYATATAATMSTAPDVPKDAQPAVPVITTAAVDVPTAW
eukprot:6185349-Pleurochrysis_carterae.AAC.4